MRNRCPGGGSIIHHLVAKGGTLKPLFQQAILMSGAWEPKYAPSQQESTYKLFAESAGCKSLSIACLRTRTEKELQLGNHAVVLSAQPRFFGWGPVVDGTYVRDLPGIEMAKGNYWPNIPILMGHTSNEGFIFINPNIVTSEKVNEFLDTNFPFANQTVRDQIVSYYPPPPVPGRYKTQFDRVASLVGEWDVTCNTRYLAQAYAGIAYTYRYSIPPGLHGRDLLLAFWRPELNMTALGPFATVFQGYFTSFVRSGNPNTYREKGIKAIDFPKAKVGQYVTVLDVNLRGFREITDKEVPKDRCAWWQSGVWTGRTNSGLS
jgi:carboxylesterase type B